MKKVQALTCKVERTAVRIAVLYIIMAILLKVYEKGSSLM